jgi:hypothetical protein
MLILLAIGSAARATHGRATAPAVLAPRGGLG